MELRNLGRTGLSVYPISLGASSLGGGVFGQVDEHSAIRTVHTALDLGVKLIDVSPFYGMTRAETVLGKALRGVSRDRFLLSTKIGRYGDQEFDFSASRVRRSIEESLDRLGVDYVDLMHVHDVEYGDLKQIEAETIPAMRKLIGEGKARLLGVTGYPLKALRLLSAAPGVDVVLTYNHYSLNDTTLLSALPEFKKRNLGIINAGALSQGLLTDYELPPWHPAPAAVRKSCAAAADWVRSKGSTVAKLAIQFSTQNADIPTTLIGTADPVQIRQSVEWAAEPLDRSLLEGVEQLLAPIKDRTWTTGRTENN
jgi:aryl-alcohol dehydrogenase-like predicted oxidoreductase